MSGTGEEETAEWMLGFLVERGAWHGCRDWGGLDRRTRGAFTDMAGLMELRRHPVQVLNGEPSYDDFARDVSEKLDRLKAVGVPVTAVFLREDIWPDQIFMHVMGHPLVRVRRDHHVTWGVLT